MADLKTLDAILRLFPEVTKAVEEYRQVRPDREIRGIARGLANEQALYTQFAQQVALLSQSSASASTLGQKSLDRLGPGKTDFIRNGLKDMEDLLHKLKTDLNNFSVSAAVLKEIKTRGGNSLSSRRNAQKTPFMQRLEKLGRLNANLRECLLDSRMPLPLPDEAQPILISRTFFHHDRLQLEQAFATIMAGRARGGTGREADSAIMRCRCPKCNPQFEKPDLAECGWDLEAFFLAQPTEDDINTQVAPTLPSDESHHFDGPVAIQASKSHQDKAVKWTSLLVKNLDGGTSQPLHSEHPNKVFMPLGDLMDHRDVLNYPQRMDLCFRLSLSVLQMSSTPWLEESWTLDDWWIAVNGERENEPLNLFVRRKLPSSTEPPRPTFKEPSWSIIAHEPTLARLGIHLTELGLGRSISELRREESGLFREDDVKISDPELLDLLTVRRMLKLRVLAQRVSADFQDVVSACVNQQYRDRRHARIQDIDSRYPSFLDHAAAAILVPLYHEVHKVSGPSHVQVPKSGSSRGDLERATGRVSASNREDNAVSSDKRPRKRALSPGNNPHDEGGDPRPPEPRRPGDEAPASLIPEHSSQGPAPSDKTTGQQDDITLPDAPLAASECGHSAVLVPTRSDQSEQPSRDTPQSDSTEGQLVEKPQLTKSEPGTEKSHVQRAESDDASDDSFGTYTEVTYSTMTWPHPRPPSLPPNHPFHRFKKILLQFILGRFQVLTAAGNGAGVSGQPTQTAPRGPSKKRPWNRRNDKDLGPDDDDDENDDSKGLQNARKKMRGEKDGSTFACPFLKKDPIAHQGCCLFVLSRIRDVKQHLRRRHQMPPYCPRCAQTFETEDERDEHIMNVDCPRKPGKPDGITEKQRKLLSEKAPASQTPEVQWFGIFRVLFPDHETLPQSPFMDMDSTFFQSSVKYQEFVLGQGPALLGDLLTARGVVAWNLPNEERDRTSLLHDILREGLGILFDRYLLESRGSPTTSPEYQVSRERTHDLDAFSGRVERESTVDASTVGAQYGVSLDMMSEHSHSLHSYNTGTYSATTERSDQYMVGLNAGLGALLHDATEDGFAHMLPGHHMDFPPWQGGNFG